MQHIVDKNQHIEFRSTPKDIRLIKDYPEKADNAHQRCPVNPLHVVPLRVSYGSLHNDSACSFRCLGN